MQQRGSGCSTPRGLGLNKSCLAWDLEGVAANENESKKGIGDTEWTWYVPQLNLLPMPRNEAPAESDSGRLAGRDGA
jgi:hypothetical protein